MSKILSEEIHLRGNIIESLEGELTKVLAENVKLKAENKQSHIDIGRMAEAHQIEMRKQIGYIQHKVDQLTEIIDNYSKLIDIHKNWEA